MLDTIVRRATQKASVEKAVLGPGAAVMSWGTPIDQVTRDETRVLRDALTVYRTNRWINRAESVISSRVGGVKWHLEDENGEEVNDDSPEPLRMIRDVLEKPLSDQQMAAAYPSQPSTRRALWGVTSRHMGLCNVGFWHLDELDRAMNFPKRIFYIRPDRMTPVVHGGSLTGWKLDAKADGGGTPLSLEEILPFYLDQPDKGYFGVGLPESIWATLSMPSAIDGHALDTLGSGGRLPGLYAPKEQGSDAIFDRLANDLRVLKDMPDSAKRDVVARIPMDFTPTAADMASLNVILLSQMSRDDTLTHWGVPLSTIGGSSPSGLNSGEQRKYDEAALWQNAVQFRIDALQETIQLRLLDRLQATGMYVSLEIDVPTFDDETPKYDLAVKAQNLPLRNIERRALLGLDPFGVPALDDAIWMPSGTVPVELAQVRGGLLSVDEARANLKLAPMTYDETPTPPELLEQVKANIITVDEARAHMGLGPMQYDETPTPDGLMDQLKAGVLTVDEVRAKLGHGPMEWADGPNESDLLEYFKAGVLTHDEMRGKIGLPAMEWTDELSKDEVETINAQIQAGLLTIDEARTQLNRPVVTWPEDLNEKVKQASALIRAGFDPNDVMLHLGLPPIKHLGLPSVTEQGLVKRFFPPEGDAAKAQAIAGLRVASSRVTPKMEKAVASFLAEQKKEIASRIRAKSDHLAKKPTDISVWWDAKKWDKRLAEVLEPYADQISGMTAKHIGELLGKDKR